MTSPGTVDLGELGDLERQVRRLSERVKSMGLSSTVIAAAGRLGEALATDRHRLTRVPHRPVRQVDEYFCPGCGRRWDIAEDEPAVSCTGPAE